MKRIAARTIYTLIVLLLSSIAVFYAIRLSGGDAVSARLPASASYEEREEFRELLGLNDPVHEQYFRYMGRLLTFDLGKSLTNNADIFDMLTHHGKNSLILGAAAFGLVFAIGVPLGILAAVRRNSWADGSVMTFSVAGMAVPNFWLALLTVWLFASTLGWLPSAGCCSFKQLILPAVVLAMEGIALTVRMTRSAMLENLGQDFVRTLRAGGLSEASIIGKHVLRNAMVPIISLAGLRIGQIVGYALVVETIFGWPGLGQVLVNAVLRRDYPVAQFFSLVLIAIVVLSNWAADVGYTVANPGCARHEPAVSTSAAPAATNGSTGAPVLSVRNLHTAVATPEGAFDVVRDVSFDIQPNEVLCLVGESGCGKTITALSIMRLLPTPPVRITSGEIVFDGSDLTQMPARRVRDVRSERISMIFQDPLTSLDPVFTVGQVMTEVIRTHRDATKAEARDMSVDILRAVGLPAPEERFDSYPHELSGGMRQRVMIATALVLDPEILIADEPTTALDVTVQAQILERLRQEQQDRHMSMLLITHDLAVVASIADRVAVMYAGEIVEEAPVDELFSNPRHPYTQGLLRALPHASRKRRELVPIPGLVPPMQMMPPGCRFAPRCPHALEPCWTDHPPHEVEAGVGFRCFNPQPF